MPQTLITGKKLSEVTFEHFIPNFTGDEITIPNTPATNGGNIGDDKLLEVHVDGSVIYRGPTLDFQTDKTTANAHKILFNENQNGVDIYLRWMAA